MPLSPFKYVSAVLAGVVLILGVMLFFSQRHLEATIKTADVAISNSKELQASLDKQNAALEALHASSNARVADLHKALEVLHDRKDAAEKSARDLLSKPLTGNTVCERSLEADRRILERLGK